MEYPRTIFHKPVVINKITPYFKYDIGKRENEFHLLFKEKELPLQRLLYENAIFNRLALFDKKLDILDCLNYHYDSFQDKAKFVNFILTEVPFRLQQSKESEKVIFRLFNWFFPSYIPMYSTCLEWATEQKSPFSIPTADSLLLPSKYRNKLIRLFLALKLDLQVIDDNISDEELIAVLKPFNGIGNLKDPSLRSLITEVKTGKGGISPVQFPNALEDSLKKYFNSK